MKDFITGLAWVLLILSILALVVWSTVQITLYQYRAHCELMMSADKTQEWLECPL